MKKLQILLLLILFSLPSSAQTSLGPGMAYSTEIEALTLQYRFTLIFSEDWGGAADANLYLDGEEGLSIWDVNVNGYYFLDPDPNPGEALVFGLGGLNLTSIEVDDNLKRFQNLSSYELGINVGGGALFPVMDNFDLLGEAKYVLGDFDRLVLSLIVQFPIR